MRIVFIGASKIGLKCLEAICQLPEVDVVGVVTSPEIFSISYQPNGVQNVLHADFPAFCGRQGIPFLVMEGKMRDPTIEAQIKAWSPQFILVVGWYHMIPRSIREIAPTGGLHASLLPDYSGGAPLVWAIINGEKMTGITFFQMDDGVDSGPIIAQHVEPILYEDTIGTLYGRIEAAAVQLLLDQLPKLSRGEAKLTHQDETKRRCMPQRNPEDGLVDWSWGANRLYDFVRAQTAPYPGAFTHFGGNKVILWMVQRAASQCHEASPGKVLAFVKESPSGLLIATGDSHEALLVQRVGTTTYQDEDAIDFARRVNLRLGDKLGI